MSADFVKLFRNHESFTPGVVDDGPDSWAYVLVAAIVALAIALAILTAGVM